MGSVNIRDAMDRVPFQAFNRELDGGKTLHVPHRDFILLTPAGNAAVVVEGEHTHVVDVDHISMIKFVQSKAA